VGGDERIRLFCALTLPDDVLRVLDEWRRAFEPGEYRLVPAEAMHATLAFLGWTPAGRVPEIAGELAAAAAEAGEIVLRARRYRETRSVGMLVCEDEGGAGAQLAGDLGERLERLGVYRPEARPWLPHVTLVRFRRPPRLRPEAPEVGEIRPVRAGLYRSLLRPGGAQYDVVESVQLGR
jgi:2'-5' RNA ligase